MSARARKKKSHRYFFELPKQPLSEWMVGSKCQERNRAERGQGDPLFVLLCRSIKAVTLEDDLLKFAVKPLVKSGHKREKKRSAVYLCPLQQDLL